MANQVVVWKILGFVVVINFIRKHTSAKSCVLYLKKNVFPSTVYKDFTSTLQHFSEPRKKLRRLSISVNYCKKS